MPRSNLALVGWGLLRQRTARNDDVISLEQLPQLIELIHIIRVLPIDHTEVINRLRLCRKKRAVQYDEFLKVGQDGKVDLLRRLAVLRGIRIRIHLIQPARVFHRILDLLGIHHQHIAPVQVQDVIGAQSLFIGRLHLEFIMRVRKPFIFRVPIQITEQRTNKVILDLRLCRLLQRGFVRAKIFHKFGNLRSGFFFGVGHKWGLPGLDLRPCYFTTKKGFICIFSNMAVPRSGKS